MPTWLIIILTAFCTYGLTLVLSQFRAREKRVQHNIEHLYGPRDGQFRRIMGQLLPPPIVEGNRVTALYNGVQIFPAMLAAIRHARHTICFETYIYWSGGIAREFAEALMERARAGVRVHVLIDWVGSLPMEDGVLEEMRASAVQVERYHKLHWYNLRNTNNRTHRKLLVIDGRIGFTGGVGIADEWTGDATDPHHWRDTQFRVEGPCVGQLQAAFMDNWMKTHAVVLHSEEYFPQNEPVGDAPAQVFMSSPSEGSESARLLYLLSIVAAERSVRIATAYFVPDDLSVETLIQARRRGVEVEIVLPGPYIDSRAVKWASRARWGPLLQAGVAIYEYQPTMYHTKVMIVDDVWVVVGSANFDNRSFRLNDEVNLNLLDAELAREQVQWFERDKQRARRISYEEWRQRPWRHKVREKVGELLRSQV